VKSRLNLDELTLGGSAGAQFVTLGKRIGRRLYVGFEQGLGAVHTVLRLEYELTRRLAVRAQAGETSLIGLFYRYRWD
jgi:translocation and assembly module TamB